MEHGSQKVLRQQNRFLSKKLARVYDLHEAGNEFFKTKNKIGTQKNTTLGSIMLGFIEIVMTPRTFSVVFRISVA